MVPVRLFYDFLVEEGVRQSNPVGRGRYTPGRLRGSRQRGLVPRLTRLPWIPTEQEWLAILAVAAREPVRNRLMLALAYDAALRLGSCPRCARTTWTRRAAYCGCGRRPRRTTWSVSCRTPRRPGSCFRPT